MKPFSVTMLCAGVLLASVATAAVARDLPDLVIVGSELRHSGDCSGRRPLIIGPVQIKNVGQGRGQIFTTKVMLRVRAKAYPALRGDDRFVNSMRPGEVVTVEARIGSSQRLSTNGQVELELNVDPANVFPEENEANNTARVTINIRCP